MADCVVCFDRYGPRRLPKVLPCGHTFCLSCLEAMAATRSGALLALVCPLCTAAVGRVPALLPTVFQLLVEEGPAAATIPRGREICAPPGRPQHLDARRVAAAHDNQRNAAAAAAAAAPARALARVHVVPRLPRPPQAGGGNTIAWVLVIVCLIIWVSLQHVGPEGQDTARTLVIAGVVGMSRFYEHVALTLAMLDSKVLALEAELLQLSQHTHASVYPALEQGSSQLMLKLATHLLQPLVRARVAELLWAFTCWLMRTTPLLNSLVLLVTIAFRGGRGRLLVWEVVKVVFCLALLRLLAADWWGFCLKGFFIVGTVLR